MPGAGHLSPPGLQALGNSRKWHVPACGLRRCCGSDGASGGEGAASGAGTATLIGASRPANAPPLGNGTPQGPFVSAPPQEQPASGTYRFGVPSGTAPPQGRLASLSGTSPLRHGPPQGRLASAPLRNAMSPQGQRERRALWPLMQLHRHSPFSGLRACRLSLSSRFGFCINFLHMAVNTV